MIVDEFLRWVFRASLSERSDAATALARSYLYSDLDSREALAVEAALAVLLDDPQPVIRKRLAETFASHPDAPRSILLPLINDLPEIAEIVLKNSPILADAELIDVLAGGQRRVQIAIANRSTLSPALCAAMAEVGMREACIELLKNPSSRFSPLSLECLVDRFGEDAELRNILFTYRDLPVTLRHRLLARLSEALCGMDLVKNTLSAKRSQDLCREYCDKAALALFGDDYDQNDLIALVEHLKLSDRLTPALVLRAACLGNIRFVSAVLASLSRLSAKKVDGLMKQGTQSAFYTLFSRTDLPEAAWPALWASVLVWREIMREDYDLDQASFARQVLQRILSMRTGLSDVELGQLLSLMRRYVSDSLRESARNYAEACRQAA